MLVQMFGVDVDAALTALALSGGKFAVAGQLLCQEQQREAAQRRHGTRSAKRHRLLCRRRPLKRGARSGRRHKR